MNWEPCNSWAEILWPGACFLEFQFFRRALLFFFMFMGVSQNGQFTRQNPVKLDDLGVPLLQETTISLEASGGRKIFYKVPPATYESVIVTCV